MKIVPIILQVGPHSAPRHRAGCGPEPLRSSTGPASPPSSPKGLPFAGLELEEGAEGTAPPPRRGADSWWLTASLSCFLSLGPGLGGVPGILLDSLSLLGHALLCFRQSEAPSGSRLRKPREALALHLGDRLLLGEALSSQTSLGLALPMRGVR